MIGARPVGPWQHEIVREWRERDGHGEHDQMTRADLVEAVNGYDDQVMHRVGEGSHPEGRAHLRALIRAGLAMIDRIRE